jgi:glycerophosphoryl diester phosphodiesterase
MTGVDKEVADSTIAELKTLRLAGTDESIPTFEETAQLVGTQAPLLVEIKTGPSPAAVCPAVLASLRAHNVTFAIMSFDPRVLMWLKRHSPATRRLQLSGALRAEPVPAATKLLLRSMLMNVVTGPQGIAYDIASTPSLALSLWRHLLRCDVLFWTVDSPAALDRARRMKGNVIFENGRP